MYPGQKGQLFLSPCLDAKVHRRDSGQQGYLCLGIPIALMKEGLQKYWDTVYSPSGINHM